MKRLLVTFLILMAQQSQPTPGPRAVRLKDDLTDFPRSQLRLNAPGPVSLETGTSVRASFTALAEMAGLNVIFDSDVRADTATPSRIESADIREAFDLLSKRTGNAVEVVDGHTVIVFPDVASKHMSYDVHVLKTFYLKRLTAPEGLNQVVTALRLLNFRNIATSTAKTIIVAPDSPTKRRSYQPLIVKTFYLPRNSSPKEVTEIITALRSVLNCRYIAQVPTMNVIAVREVPNKMALVEAMMRDLVQPVGGLTASDSVPSGTESAVPGSEASVVKIIPLPNLSAVGVTEVVTSLRTLLNMRQIDTSGNSIVIQDNAEKVAIAEKLVADLLKPAAR